MADQDQTNDESRREQRRQRREPPRLVVINHEVGDAKKIQDGGYDVPLTIWVVKQNCEEPEQVYCQLRVNQDDAHITREELLGEDGVIQITLTVRGFKFYVETKLRWRFDQSPAWEPIGSITISDPDKDPEHEMLCQRIALAISRYFGWGERQNEPEPDTTEPPPL